MTAEYPPSVFKYGEWRNLRGELLTPEQIAALNYQHQLDERQRHTDSILAQCRSEAETRAREERGAAMGLAIGLVGAAIILWIGAVVILAIP